MNRWEELITAPRAARLRTLLYKAAVTAHAENAERFAPEDLGDDARIYGICTSNSARFLAGRAVEDADLAGVAVRERGLVWWLEIDRDTDAAVRYFYKAPPGASTVWDLRLDDAEIKRELSASNGRQLELFSRTGRQGYAELLNLIVIHYGDPHEGPGKLEVGAPYVSNDALSWDWHERFDLAEDQTDSSSSHLLGDDSDGFEGLRLIDPLPAEDGLSDDGPHAQSPGQASDDGGSVGFDSMQMREEPVDEEQDKETGEESS